MGIRVTSHQYQHVQIIYMLLKFLKSMAIAQNIRLNQMGLNFAFHSFIAKRMSPLSDLIEDYSKGGALVRVLCSRAAAVVTPPSHPS